MALIPVKHKRGTLLQWQSENPILLEGQIGFVGYSNFIIGDGVRDFNDLWADDLYKYACVSFSNAGIAAIVTAITDPVIDALQIETNRAIDAEQAIGVSLGQEVTARQQTDTNLTGLTTTVAGVATSVSNEATARSVADAALQTLIDDITSFINSGQVQILATNAFLTTSIPGLSATEVETALNEIMTILSGLGSGLPTGASGEYLTYDSTFKVIDASEVAYDDFLYGIGATVQVALDYAAGVALLVQSDLVVHATSTSNPHAVTKAQVGLGNVDNTSDANKQLGSPAMQQVEALISFRA